ncbi:hypothetical protein N9937_00650 [bacterium]|nr:hypothetical protein [bacterium]
MEETTQAVSVPAVLNEGQIQAQVQLIQRVMAEVMKKGSHFDTIQGCGNKPVLLKAGAEKIAATFRLAIEPEIEDLSEDGEIRYRIKTILTHSPTGRIVGYGVGECSSLENKYKWKGAACDEEFDETPADRRRVAYKYNKKTKQVRMEPADIANTVLKMAKKRSMVDGVLTSTAASDLFNQDLEDLPAEARSQQAEDKPPVKTPQKKAAPTGNIISDAQRKRMWAIAKQEAGLDDKQFKEFVVSHGFDSSSKVTKDAYEVMCEQLTNMGKASA